MSYCVNCGVEISEEEKKCPLCQTAVVHPQKAECETAESKYPSRVEPIEASIDRQFWVKMVSVFLAVPVLICFVCNLLYDGAVSWSLYPIGGIAVLWVFGVSPFLFKKPVAIKWIVIDSIALLGYLYLLETVTHSGAWFLPLALPIVVAVGIFVLLITIFIQKNRLKGLYIFSVIFFALGVLMIGVEIVIDSYLFMSIHIVWSWFVLISCTALAFVIIFIERKKKLKEELKRRLHI
jgi:hypothetical protein